MAINPRRSHSMKMITRQTGHQMKYIWNVSVFLHITFTSVERKDEFRCIIMRNNLCRIIYRRSVAYVKWHGNLICQLCIVSCLITCTDIDKCYIFFLSHFESTIFQFQLNNSIDFYDFFETRSIGWTIHLEWTVAGNNVELVNRFAMINN